jgi:hypothetical protein
MGIFLGQTIGFWTGLLGAVFIVLHMPTCNTHWAQKLPLISKPLASHHHLTLSLATVFGFGHLMLAFLGLVFGIWI